MCQLAVFEAHDCSKKASVPGPCLSIGAWLTVAGRLGEDRGDWDDSRMWGSSRQANLFPKPHSHTGVDCDEELPGNQTLEGQLIGWTHD